MTSKRRLIVLTGFDPWKLWLLETYLKLQGFSSVRAEDLLTGCDDPGGDLVAMLAWDQVTRARAEQFESLGAQVVGVGLIGSKRNTPECMVAARIWVYHLGAVAGQLLAAVDTLNRGEPDAQGRVWEYITIGLDRLVKPPQFPV